jgi:class 3 adenylate cyclase
MKKWDTFKDGDIINALICFSDITNFAKSAKSMPMSDMAKFLKEAASNTTRYIEMASGRIVKHIGDSALIILPEESIDYTIKVLIQMKTELDHLLSSYNPLMKITLSLSYGELIFVQLDPFPMLDVFGDVVNKAAMLNNMPQHKGMFVVSEKIIELVKEETKALFREVRPAAVYLADLK